MNPIEVNQIYVEYIHAINGLWEIWLATTFAFIVAFHIGKASITKALTWIGCSLYFFASAAILVRYLNYVDAMGVWIGRIRDSEFAVPTPSLPYAPLLTIGVFVVGTLVAVGYAIYEYRASNDT